MGDNSSKPALLRQMAEGLHRGVHQRAGLNWFDPPEGIPRPRLSLLLGEIGHIAEPLRRRARSPLLIEPAVQRRMVMALPGFAANEEKMRYMAQSLERAGHKVKRWGLGRNMGANEENLAMLGERLRAIHARYDEKVYLVGWSLGGIFAREVAKLHPECVAKVVTMGSPFSQSPYANNVWRAYQLVTGQSVAEPPIATVLHEKPPVETVALWSPRDGAIAPRSACGRPGERDRARALRCTHMGFCDSPEAILAVLEELV